MCPRQTQFTRQTSFFFLTTPWGMAGTEKHTNTIWPSPMWPAVSKRLNSWPRKNRLRYQALFRKFTNAGLWNSHSFCKWTMDANSRVVSPKRSKTHIKHSRREGGYSPRPGHRRKIQPHPCCAPLRAPVCSRNEAVRGPKIFRMGGATSRCGPTLNCEVTQLTGKKPGEAIKECRLFQACDSLRQTCWRAWKVDPLFGGCSLSLPTWWAWGRKGKSHRSDLKVYDIEKTITNPKWTDFALFAERPQAWLCLRGSSCRACRHWAAVSLMASPTAPATTSSPECETLSAQCGCRPPEPSVSRSARSAPAFFAHRCTSLLCSFSSLCLWRYLRSLPALRCTGLSAICFVVFASLLMTLSSCLFRPLRNNTCCTRQSC